MQHRSVLFGIGTGIIVASMVFYLGLFLWGNVEAEEILVEYTDEEIMERAGKLGMISIKELPEAAASKPVSDEEVILRAEAMGYVLPEDQIDEEAGDASMDEDILDTPSPEPMPNERLNTPAPTPNVSLNTPAPVIYEPDEDGITRVVIPGGANSAEIARILYNSGVIDNVEDFNAYVISTERTTRLKAGTFQFEEELDYEEVIDILTGR